MSVRVTTGARLHFGFQNLSLARERLYGSLGVTLDEPRLSVEAETAPEVHCSNDDARPYVHRAVELLDLPGASVTVTEGLPRHVGLGSGTQLALATFVAVARAYGEPDAVRPHAPALDRGGRSGVGVATFERGGFVMDAGHPTERFTTARPDRGTWTVPEVTARQAIPEDWRFVLVLPDSRPGRSGEVENESMRSVIERADASIADEISQVMTQQVLPALADEDRETFGRAVAEIGKLNGAWYTDEQGGVYRPPVGTIVDELTADHAVSGAGQSSWGPATYGVTDRAHADGAREAAHAALDAADVSGEVSLVVPRNDGACVETR